MNSSINKGWFSYIILFINTIFILSGIFVYCYSITLILFSSVIILTFTSFGFIELLVFYIFFKKIYYWLKTFFKYKHMSYRFYSQNCVGWAPGFQIFDLLKFYLCLNLCIPSLLRFLTHQLLRSVFIYLPWGRSLFYFSLSLNLVDFIVIKEHTPMM